MHIYDADNAEARCLKHRLAAGQKLLSLRQRIEAGEEGDVAWWDWFEKQDIGRGRKDCEKLMRIASADDPEAALVEDREKTRLAVAKHRETKKADGVYVNSRAQLVTKSEQFCEDNARAWKADWLRCHPGRTPEEYEQILHSEQPGGDGPMWTWRRAFNRAAHEAERAAWLRDHPGNPLPEHMCSLSEDETAEYEKWLETYEPPLISVPMPDDDEPRRKRRSSAEVEAEHVADQIAAFEFVMVCPTGGDARGKASTHHQGVRPGSPGGAAIDDDGL